MDKTKFTFVNKKSDIYDFVPKKQLFTFYQICQFKNNATGKFAVKKIVFDQDGKILKTFTNERSGKKVELFMEKNQSSKYALYPTYDITIVGLPNPAQLLEVQSQLVNSNNDYYGCAEF